MRHWLVLVLAAQIFLPHAHSVWAQLAVLPLVLVVLCAALALTETLTAKMRILLAPRLLAGRRDRGAARRRLLAGAADVSGALVWLLVALGLGVVVVRRRSLAVGLVTAQALAARRRGACTAAPRTRRPRRAALAIRAVALGALLLLVVSRTREPRPVRAGIAPIARGGLAVGFRARAHLARAGDRPRLAQRRARRARADRLRRHTAATRRATLFQVLGIVLVRERPRARRARAAAAAPRPRSSSGVAFDLTLVALVAAVFHERIFAEFGAGDTAALRSLRD